MIDFSSMKPGDVVPLDMRPAQTSDDSMALLTADAVHGAKLDERYAAFGVACSDRNNIGSRYLHHAMLFADFLGESIARMKNVVSVAQPLKVRHMIVGGVEVNMVHLKTFRRIANECPGYKLVDQVQNLDATPVELDATMPVFALSWPQIRSASKTQYIAKIRDVVKILVAGNWLPDFIHIKPLLVDSSVSVAWQPAQKPAFGSYPSQAGGF